MAFDLDLKAAEPFGIGQRIRKGKEPRAEERNPAQPGLLEQHQTGLDIVQGCITEGLEKLSSGL